MVAAVPVSDHLNTMRLGLVHVFLPLGIPTYGDVLLGSLLVDVAVVDAVGVAISKRPSGVRLPREVNES